MFFSAYLTTESQIGNGFSCNILLTINSVTRKGKVSVMADKISGNIVQIQDYAGLTKKSGTSNSSRLLQDCRNTVLERTADALARAMDNVDDTLFATSTY